MIINGVSKESAELVFSELKEKAIMEGYSAEYFDKSATLRSDSNGWSSNDNVWCIMWEEGPYQWPYEMLWETNVPGVYVECISSWGLVGIYKSYE